MRPYYRGAPISRPWHKPWLIQRLQKPVEISEGHILHGKDNPFAFGGGLQDGGFSKEAMALFRPIFQFDYMGSAEFEFGAVPKAVESMAKTIDEITTASFEIDVKTIDFKTWDEKYYNKPVAGTKKTIYVIAKKDHHADAEKYIRSLVKVTDRNLKEDSRFRTALLEPKEPKDSWTHQIQGWFDIDNCLFFFADKEMFEKTAALMLEKQEKAEKKS